VILVDTSIWVDHLRKRDAKLAGHLEAGLVLSHPFVIGEIALGHLHLRSAILTALADLPQAQIATHGEVLEFIEANGLAGTGLGYGDAHLLASVRLTDTTLLWTRDKRLLSVAQRLRLAVA
jgi:predicted nucleic acid-binding protein